MIMGQRIILASHGKFASGILSSLELICGENKKIITLDCYTEENFDLTSSVDILMKENEQNELIVVTDIFGGSVNNEFLRYIYQPNFYLVAGLNLPFLIELITQINVTESISDSIKQALDCSKNTIQFCNETITKNLEEETF